jgi:hypothetical protein
MEKFTKALFAIGCTVALVGCQGAEETTDIWTIDRCIDEGGLFIESPAQKCRIDGEEYIISVTVDMQKHLSAKEGDVSDGFIAALKDLDIAFEPLTAIEEPLLGNSGLTLLIENEIVLVFAYSSDEAAANDGELLRTESRLANGLRITWENVRYAVRGNEIAVYAGDSSRIVEVLEMAEALE